jgi:metallo-beta-lactamase family protein
MVKIKFNGAAGTVTGSNYLVETENTSFVVDCGMFQGREVENLNLKDFEYDASKVEFALLTHAHIDHSGMLPKLFRHGFTGPIYATSHTIQISTELLLDSAKIQEDNYERGNFYGKYSQIRALVYDTKDAMGTIDLFSAVDYDQEFSPAPGIKVKYLMNGHILGAAALEIDIEDEGKTKKFIFSGDVGRLQSTIITTFDLNYKSNPDYVLIESLYGGIIHQDRNESARKLVEIINETLAGGGNVYIPSFAVERTQEILSDLREAKENGTLAKSVKVWLDSPLAQRVTRIYTSSLQTTEKSLFDFENLVYVKKYRQSQGLSKISGQVIIAGSGMADGGRIVNHLARGLENKKNAVVFVGFQAEETLGRELVEGAKSVRIGVKSVTVRARIEQLEGFSAHGDNNDYTKWIERFKTDNLKKVFLIHAEPDRALALQEHFNNNLGIKNTEIPTLGEEVTL